MSTTHILIDLKKYKIHFAIFVVILLPTILLLSIITDEYLKGLVSWVFGSYSPYFDRGFAMFSTAFVIFVYTVFFWGGYFKRLSDREKDRISDLLFDSHTHRVRQQKYTTFYKCLQETNNLTNAHLSNVVNQLSATRTQVAERAGEMLKKLVPDIQKTAELVQEISSASTAKELSSQAEQLLETIGFFKLDESIIGPL